MNEPITCVVLAAGKGTRMKSQIHKVLHKVGGRSLLDHVLAGVEPLNPEQTIIVVGSGREQIEGAIKGRQGLKTALQEPQNGTGHAVQCAQAALDISAGVTLILYGDVPFVPTDTNRALVEKALESAGPVVLGFEAHDPGSYGRLVLGQNGALSRIVEAKDANDAELAIRLCNSGIMAVPTALLFSLLEEVKNDNAAGEYYLTDIVEIAAAREIPCTVVTALENDVMGVNSRADLASAEAAFQTKRRTDMMAKGVTLYSPETTYFQWDTEISSDVDIEPNVIFGPNVRVERDVTIRAFSHLEGCTIKKGASVGPYARLRPGADIGPGVKIGNFVEVKNAALAAGAKASHLSYIGDADVGEGANIGAGTITCNYDGYFKHRTTIGANAFIGSNTSLVAPVVVGEGAITGAGSAITKDVDEGALAVTRAPQSHRKGWAARFMATMAAKKAGKSA